MSFNPDDVESSAAEIDRLREENTGLRAQVEELTQRLAEQGLINREDSQSAQSNVGEGAAASYSLPKGRRCIPYHRRSENQHQGRMAYLLKKLEDGSEARWNQDLIADLQTYCVENASFYEQVKQAYGAEDIDNIDTLIAMLQSH